MILVDANLPTIFPLLKSGPLPNITSPEWSKHILLHSCEYSPLLQTYYSIQLKIHPPSLTPPSQPQTTSTQPKQTLLSGTLVLHNQKNYHTMDWPISQKKRNKLQHALNGNPDLDTPIPNTILQLQEMVNAMTLDIMRQLPPYFPDVLQYTASSAINDFIQKNGIETSKKQDTSGSLQVT